MSPYKPFQLSAFFVLLCISSYCSGNKETSTVGGQPYDSLPNKKIIIEDKTKYSNTFINSLREFLRYRKDSVIRLADSVVITPEYKVLFPRHPKLNKHYTLIANGANGESYELGVHRVNYSDLEFRLTIKSGLETILMSEGIAVLSPGFIMASESYDDEVSGGAYDAQNYMSHTDKCDISFVMGSSMGEILGKIKEVTCVDSRGSELIEKMPTLRARIK